VGIKWSRYAERSMSYVTPITRSHGSVRVFKDDRQSQWGMAKFDTQPTLYP